jgi:protocatechuate 3,4-dioxygenase alpha subunit
MPDNQSPELFGQTPWQTVGPFFHYGLPWKGGADLTGTSALGARADLFPPEHYLLRQPAAREPVTGTPVEIIGCVLDGEHQPVPDALVEIWQADHAGHYNDPQSPFPGFGRSATGDKGEYRFLTIMPGRVPGPGNAWQAPHIALGVMGRGLIKRLVTRLYFEDGEGNDTDPVLGQVALERRHTLLARRSAGAALIYTFDILLQGHDETVFFTF